MLNTVKERQAQNRLRKRTCHPSFDVCAVQQ